MFKKGQPVTLLQNWDNEGTVRIVDLTVHSCGEQRMVLVDEQGKEFEGHWLAQTEQHSMSFVVSRLSAEDAEAAAIKLGGKIIIAEKERMERCIARYGDDAAYVRVLRESIAALHEPRAERFDPEVR